MSNTRVYSKSSNFGGNLNPWQLQKEIEKDARITTAIDYIEVNGDVVTLKFQSNLSAGEITILDTDRVTNHSMTNTNGITTSTNVLSAGGSVKISHDLDYAYTRKIDVYIKDTESLIDATFHLGASPSSDYSISDAVNSEIDGSTFVLTPASGGFTSSATDLALAGTASASSEQAPASNAIDGNADTFWYNAAGTSPNESWWQVNLGSVKSIWGCEIVWHSTSYYARTVEIQGSKNGNKWTSIQTYNNITYATGTTTMDFTNIVNYKHIRVLFTNSINSTYVVCRTIKVIEPGFSGAFATNTPSVMTNILANRQIDASDWASIDGIQIISIEPAGTTIKFLFSFDGQTTWKYYDSGWQTSTLGNIGTNGMTTAAVQALTDAQLRESGGLAYDSPTIDFACELNSTSSGATPSFTSMEFDVTTKEYYELVGLETVRVRMIAPNRVEIKNISDTSKTVFTRISVA